MTYPPLRALRACSLTLMAGQLGTAALSQSLSLELITNGLVEPVFATAPAGDERIFVLEQHAGTVRIVADGVPLPTPFLDISASINSLHEGGLLGLAFHPQYTQNGRFYVLSSNPVWETVIEEYHVSNNPDVADPTPAGQLLSLPQPHFWHNGGAMEFGPDGMLYVGLGDGGNPHDPYNRAQDPALKFGKLLRLDVDAPFPHVPADNPFVGQPGHDETVWAIGLRNPWRISFDSATGDLWIADVGQGLREEIDFQPAGSMGGENYGWNCMEATLCHTGSCTCDTPDLVLPIHSYPHGDECAIIGGGVYRGSELPEHVGRYFWADFCTRRFWSLRYEGGAVTDVAEHTLELSPEWPLSLERLHSFGTDGQGELLVIDAEGGELFRIRPACSATPACMTSPNSSGAGARITASGSLRIADEDLSFHVSGLPPLESALVFYGGPGDPLPYWDGYLCVGAPQGLYRIGAPVHSAADGSLDLHVDWSGSPLAAGSGQVFPGSTWRFQAWYRDPGGPGGSGINFSDAVDLRFCP